MEMRLTSKASIQFNKQTLTAGCWPGQTGDATQRCCCWNWVLNGFFPFVLCMLVTWTWKVLKHLCKCPRCWNVILKTTLGEVWRLQNEGAVLLFCIFMDCFKVWIWTGCRSSDLRTACSEYVKTSTWAEMFPHWMGKKKGRLSVSHSWEQVCWNDGETRRCKVQTGIGVFFWSCRKLQFLLQFEQHCRGSARRKHIDWSYVSGFGLMVMVVSSLEHVWIEHHNWKRKVQLQADTKGSDSSSKHFYTFESAASCCLMCSRCLLLWCCIITIKLRRMPLPKEMGASDATFTKSGLHTEEAEVSWLSWPCVSGFHVQKSWVNVWLRKFACPSLGFTCKTCGQWPVGKGWSRWTLTSQRLGFVSEVWVASVSKHGSTKGLTIDHEREIRSWWFVPGRNYDTKSFIYLNRTGGEAWSNNISEISMNLLFRAKPLPTVKLTSSCAGIG